MNTKLLKVAHHIREKRAGIGGDLSRDIASSALIPTVAGSASGGAPAAPAVGAVSLMATLGQLHGIFGKTPSLEGVQAMDADPDKSFIPGVGWSRFFRRRRALRKLLRDKPELLNFPLSEMTGMILNPAILAGAGGFATNLAGNPEPGVDAGIRLSYCGTALGSLAAALTKRRTLEEQAKVDNSLGRSFLQHIVPGLAAYDFWKGIGATRNLSGNIDEIKAQLQEVKNKRRKQQDYED